MDYDILYINHLALRTLQSRIKSGLEYERDEASGLYGVLLQVPLIENIQAIARNHGLSVSDTIIQYFRKVD